MYNSAKIIVGILIFLALFTFPIWYSRGTAAPPPKLELPVKEKECVAPIPYMKSSHMELLVSWRDAVVRERQLIYTNPDGKKYVMGLQTTCMSCHTSKTNFCDRCHNYLNVSPKCWDCHIEPVEKTEKTAGRTE